VGAETAQWIVPQSDGAETGNGAEREVPSHEPASSPAAADQIAAPGPNDTRALEAKVARLEMERAKLENENVELTKSFERREARLNKRIDELESELAEAKQSAEAARTAPARKSTAESSRTRKSKRATAKRGTKSTPSRRSSAKSGKIDLNVATFEELRSLGLSVTQSARLIAYRDVRGGYESLDELDEIPGLSRQTRSDLGSHLTLAS
jgi:DNA uptake protein ComE-like DNA-binding protein